MMTRIRRGDPGSGLIRGAAAAVTLAVVAWAGTASAGAHCDSLDGPIARDARRAIAAGDVSPVLKWVAAPDEPDIRAAFTAAIEARALGGAAARLADRYFLETVVRIHRAGEGAPYSGLKPAGTTPAVIGAADRALEAGSVDALARELSSAAAEAVRRRFRSALDLRARAEDSPEAGRRYVAAYVEYVHLVEALHATPGLPAGADGRPGPHDEHRH